MRVFMVGALATFWCLSWRNVSECLRVEGRGRSSCAKREPEGAPTAGEGAPKGGRKERKITLSERAKLRWPTRPTEVKRA